MGRSTRHGTIRPYLQQKRNENTAQDIWKGELFANLFSYGSETFMNIATRKSREDLKSLQRAFITKYAFQTTSTDTLPGLYGEQKLI